MPKEIKVEKVIKPDSGGDEVKSLTKPPPKITPPTPKPTPPPPPKSSGPKKEK